MVQVRNGQLPNDMLFLSGSSTIDGVAKVRENWWIAHALCAFLWSLSEYVVLSSLTKESLVFMIES